MELLPINFASTSINNYDIWKWSSEKKNDKNNRLCNAYELHQATLQNIDNNIFELEDTSMESSINY